MRHPTDPTMRSCPRCVKIYGSNSPKIWHKVYNMSLNGYCKTCNVTQSRERNIRRREEARKVQIQDGMVDPSTMSDEEIQYWFECGSPKDPSIFEANNDPRFQDPVYEVPADIEALHSEGREEGATFVTLEREEREQTPEEIEDAKRFAALMTEGSIEDLLE